MVCPRTLRTGLGAAIAFAITSAAIAPVRAASTSTVASDLDPQHGTAPEYGRFQDDALVRKGEFYGSIEIPDTGVSIRIGGFVNLDIVHDIDSLGFPDFVVPVSIPIDDSPLDGTSQTALTARTSRINFDVRSQSPLGEIRAFIEADFLGDGSELTSTYTFQLRHAAAQVGHLYFGQWWSSFVDVASIPEGANAPLGALTLRQPGLRWGQNLGEWFRFVVAAESPAGSLSGESAPLASESLPDFSGYLQFRTKLLRLRVSGLFRRLESAEDDALVGGVSVSGRLQLPFLGVHDNFAFQGQYGEGLSRYYQSFATAGLDAFVTESGALRPVGVIAGYVAYQHWWSERWRSSIVASALDFDIPPVAAADTFQSGQLYSLNLYWSPVDRVTLGLDASYARRRNFDGGEGSGIRLGGTARLNFWPDG